MYLGRKLLVIADEIKWNSQVYPIVISVNRRKNYDLDTPVATLACFQRSASVLVPVFFTTTWFWEVWWIIIKNKNKKEYCKASLRWYLSMPSFPFAGEFISENDFFHEFFFLVLKWRQVQRQPKKCLKSQEPILGSCKQRKSVLSMVDMQVCWKLLGFSHPDSVN
jgi:hypothetical protein